MLRDTLGWFLTVAAALLRNGLLTSCEATTLPPYQAEEQECLCLKIRESFPD